MTNFLFILLAFTLVFLNAFFVAAEFALVKLRHTQIATLVKNYGLRGKVLANVHYRLDAYLSACQLGITLASLGLGWIGEPAFSKILRPIFLHVGIHSEEVVEFLSFLIAFAFISFLHIVVGELMPKTIAIRQAEKISIWVALPLYLFYWIMFPAIWVLNSCSNFLLKISHLSQGKNGDSFYSTNEIKLILSSSYLHGELTQDESEMMSQTMDFADLEVTDIMRPIEEMIVLDLSKSIDESLNIAINNRYSRYPIVSGSIKNILGIVHMKDVFAVQFANKQIHSLQEIMRPILKLSSRLTAVELLRKFREGVSHFAVIYKNPESPIGFITLDNLLQVIVGRIKDEFHKTKEDWMAIEDGGFLFNGNSSLYNVERALKRDLFINEESTTINGLILNKLGGLPKAGEIIEFEQFKAVIVEVKGPRILKVKIFPR